MQLPKGFAGLVEIMDRLRGPDGCPWDREQDYHTLRGYLLEECHEVAEALDRGDHEDLCEELGDLLFQIVFLSRIAKEEQRFTVEDVIAGIRDKMIRRHPHVFGDASADTSAEVLKHWEAIKAREKVDKQRTAPSVLDGIPRSLPALLKAQRMGSKAARVGFDWPDSGAVRSKVEEEWGELESAIDGGETEAVREEFGDLLFALVNLGRHLDIEPEAALEAASLKFSRRFRRVEGEVERQGRAMKELSLDELEALWAQAKDQLI